ncbi:hypothetical protein [Mesobacillus boroniphilus]|uniref:hypothetical protein n=1 Tax=Mesobacillus boroniphilus TaxID=308892 RepID=UPI0012EC0BEA|nr:hypothetical protein [Mesobacillus boroniphilus]
MIKVLIHLLVLLVLLGGFNLQASAAGECDAFREATKIWWDGIELKKGQIGRLEIEKDTVLFKLDGNKKTLSRTLKKESFIVFMPLNHEC